MGSDTENRNSYGSILKATGLFGGVKIFEILISIIRSKLVALILGPSGMGVYGLILSPVAFIKQVTSLGLSTSGVREVSKAYNEKNEKRKDYIVSILRKLVWITGSLGLLVTVFMSKWLSLWSFGNENYTLWFRLVSITLLIDQLVVGQQVLMQGTFHYTFLAKSAIIGHTIGLFVTIPIYYLWGVNGVVPVFILHSLTSLLLSWYFSRKIPYKRIKLALKEMIVGGTTMIALGAAIAFTSAITYGKDFLLRVFISRTGGVADVGLFNAGITISTSYIGLVLSAMGTDYAPRLSAASNDNRQFGDIINKQLQLLLTIVGPLVAVFIVFINQVVVLLYSSKFIPITGMIEWTMLGMTFRAISFCLSYSVVAKADSKLFFLSELIATIYTFAFSIVGFKYYGFEGMGIAYLLGYFLYSAQMFFICKRRYAFHLDKITLKIILYQVFCVTVLFILCKVFYYSNLRYIVGALVAIVIFIISYNQLNTMINVNSLILSVKKRFVK